MCKLTVALLSLALAVSATAASKKVIQPKDFPTGRPFSPGILVDDTLYIAGQTGSDLKTGQLPEDFDAEVKQCLDNIGLIKLRNSNFTIWPDSTGLGWRGESR